MDERPPFRFESVARLEREDARGCDSAVLPEMANISELGVSLSGGRTALMRRFDPGATSEPSPGAVVISGSSHPQSTAHDDAMCRYLAEALSFPVVSVRERRGNGQPECEWISEWWDWFCGGGLEIGLDPDRVVVGARGEACGAVLSAMSTPGAIEGHRPRGLFMLCGGFQEINSRFVNLVIKNPRSLPPTYIASGTLGRERSPSRQLSAYLLDRCVECWYVEWPGVSARCLENISRIPELERYIDAMVVALRGLLLRDAIAPTTGTSS